MNHESESPENPQTSEPEERIELDQPPEGEIDRMQSDFEAHRLQERDQRQDELIESTKRMERISEELHAQHRSDQSHESDSQSSVDQTSKDGEMKAGQRRIPVAYERYEPTGLSPKVSQAIGQAKLKEAQAEADRQLVNHPKTASQIREDIGSPLETPEDYDIRAGRVAKRMVATMTPKDKPRQTRRGLSRMGRLNADDPPLNERDARRTY